MKPRLGLIGGRGYTGAELLSILARHPGLDLKFASSSSEAGQPLSSACAEWPNSEDVFCAVDIEQIPEWEAEAYVLATPNGVAASWAQAIHAAHPGAVIVDLSADHRFDDAWVYGLPERFREEIRGSWRIANPGCYATGSQLGLLPVLNKLEGVPAIFGVSGHSGAGKTPSARNNPARLKDNLIPYSLSGHVHEGEISYQLGRDVRFMPHVAEFFRGISLTISLNLDKPSTSDELLEIYRSAYRDEALIKVSAEPPEVAVVQGTPEVHIGGFTLDQRDARRLSLVVTLDNLAKGAATQAMQNLNLALGLEELSGIR